MKTVLVAGMLIATGLCLTIPMAAAFPHRHRAPVIVSIIAWIGIIVGSLVALLGFAMLLEVLP